MVIKCTKYVDKEYTQKCRFMGKKVREISRFFVAQLHVFTPAICNSRNSGA